VPPASPEFGLAHSAYRAFRPAYPASLYDRLLAELVPPHALAVDLGAGTGLVTAALASRFERVIAVEPDSAMAAHIHEVAPSAELQAVQAERAELEPRSVNLICCVNALYWMDAPQVLAKVGGWLRPGGVFAAWRYLFPNMAPAITRVFATEMTERWGQYRDVRVAEGDITRSWVEAEPSLELIVAEPVTNVIAMTAAEMVGFAASTSFGAAYLRTLTPEAAVAYLDELTAQLTRICDGAAADVDFELTLVVARARTVR
jgi:trans-aconitate methyltransferase